MKPYYEYLEEIIGIKFEEIRPMLKLTNPMTVNEFKDEEVNTPEHYFIKTADSIEVYKFNT